jgi:hypothetical protein
MDPVDPNIDAIVTQECNEIGTSIAVDLTAAGKKGVAINALYDFWTPSRHYQAYHGGLRILSESASANLASPITVAPDQIQSVAPGYNPREQSWNYLEPWMGGTWHLRDIIDYQLVALESCLYQAAIHREEMLRNFYTIGKRAIARTSPYAFIIPRVQNDPGASRKMLQLLQFGQVEVERAYPSGSYVIRMQQPYSSYAKTLLERQHYPDLREYPGGPPKRPYDVTAQTLPLLMGVALETIDRPLPGSLVPVQEFAFDLPVKPAAGGWAASDVDSWKFVNRAWKAGKPVFRDESNGDWFTENRAGLHSIHRPRIGLYRSYMPQMDEGWTRWLLENFEFDYKSVLNPDIEAGGLRQRFDAIIFPDQTPASITQGFKPGSMPDAYVGGLDGQAGENLKRFAAEGGTLIFLNHSTEYAVEALGIAVRNVVQGVPIRDFYAPGSLLEATLDTRSSLAYGLPAGITIWSEGSPAWELKDGSNAKIIASYPKSNVLASGWLLGAKYVEGRASLLDVPMGQGRVILFGMRPQYRAQSYQSFKLLFNALVLAMEGH